MIEILLAVGWAGTIAGFIWYTREKDALHVAEKRDLLNRIMAKDYGAYQAAEAAALPYPSRPQLLTDSAEAQYERQQRGE